MISVRRGKPICDHETFSPDTCIWVSEKDVPSARAMAVGKVYTSLLATCLQQACQRSEAKAFLEFLEETYLQSRSVIYFVAAGSSDSNDFQIVAG
jgi:hypothetical protein